MKIEAQPVSTVWRPISTAPRGVKISAARKGGQRDDGSTYWYQADGHYDHVSGRFHKSAGELYGDPELWAKYPENPEHCYAVGAPSPGTEAPATATANVVDVLASLQDWCHQQRYAIGAVDGYDYRSGEEAGIREVEIEVAKRLNEARESLKRAQAIDARNTEREHDGESQACRTIENRQRKRRR
ncbi:hypothetical protein [Bradyrhizobium sp. USDA 4350]